MATLSSTHDGAGDFLHPTLLTDSGSVQKERKKLGMACPFAGQGYYKSPWRQIQDECGRSVGVGDPIDWDRARQQDDPLIEKEHDMVLTTHDTSCSRTFCILWQGLVCICKVQVYFSMLLIRTFWGSDFDMDADDLTAWRPFPKLVRSEALPERPNLPAASGVSKHLFRRSKLVLLDPDVSQIQTLFGHSVILFFLATDRQTANPILGRGSLLADFVINNLYGVEKMVKRTGQGGKIELSNDGLPPWDAEQERFQVGNVQYGNESTYRLIMYTLLYRLHNLICNKLLEVEPDWDDEQCFQEAAKQTFYTFGKIVVLEYAPNYFGIFAWGWILTFRFMMNVVEAIRGGFFLYYTVGSLIRFLHPGKWATNFQEHIAFYRLHSLVPDTLGDEPIAEHAGNPVRFKAMGLRSAAGAVVKSAAGSIGLKNTPVVLNNKYLDVDELALQRHRDMMLGSINDFRADLGVPRNSWHSFSSSPELGKKLQDLYQEPDDVDWFVGAMANCREVSTNGSGVFGVDLMSMACHFMINGFISDVRTLIPAGGPERYDFTLSLAEILKQTRQPDEAEWDLRSDEQGGVARLRPLNAGFSTCFGRLVYNILNIAFALSLMGSFLFAFLLMALKAVFRRVGLGCLNLHNLILMVFKVLLMLGARVVFFC